MSIPGHLTNHALVIDFYGYWPSFHDAQVLAYTKTGETSLSFTLQTWRMTNQVDANGYYLLENHSLVSFTFDGVHDADMDSFRSGNILYELGFERCDNATTFRVYLRSVMDMSGEFSAASGRVDSIVPCDSEGNPS